MNPQLVIDNTGRRIDVFYLCFLIVFWIIWTPLTVWATVTAYLNFSFFWVIWLPFGYVGVFGIPYMLVQSTRPQTLLATPDSLRVSGTGIPLARVIEIPRQQEIKLHFGRYGDEGEGESVATLNIISGTSIWTKRIMIAPLSHPNEKRQIFDELQTFLLENEFRLRVDDQHPESKG